MGKFLSEVVNCVDGLWHLKDPEATDVLGRVIQGWPRHCPTGKHPSNSGGGQPHIIVTSKYAAHTFCVQKGHRFGRVHFE